MAESNTAGTVDIPELVAFGDKRFRVENNIDLCIVCQQERTNDRVVEKPQAVDNLLSRIAERAKYNVAEYVIIQKRIETVNDTEKAKVTYHRSCYVDATKSDHIQREKNKYLKNLGQPSVSSSQVQSIEEGQFYSGKN